MSDAQSYARRHEQYNNEFMKQQQQQSLDFFSFHSPSDILAPHPDLFESDIDSNLAAFSDHLQLLTVDSNDAYTFFRTENPHWQGPLSTITVSSESHDSLSNHSDSLYSESLSSFSPSANNNNPSQGFDFDLDMDFQRVRVGSDYNAVQPSITLLSGSADSITFGAMPPTPPRSPPAPYAVSKSFEKPYVRSCYSDYGPPRRNSTASDYYPQLGYSPLHTTVSPSHMTTALPAVASVTLQGSEEKSDPRKKYKCNVCPRAFARAYNLKTHMATHDPNRLKPHVCHHRSCGRSFSRRHDLGRHIISIHRDEINGSSHLPMMAKKIGVEACARSWCDSCGKGWIGRNPGCDCSDIKDIK